MDKYLLVILIFMIVTIPIAFFEPSTGELRDSPFFSLMWVAIGGIIIIVLYISFKERKEHHEANIKRRTRK